MRADCMNFKLTSKRWLLGQNGKCGVIITVALITLKFTLQYDHGIEMQKRLWHFSLAYSRSVWLAEFSACKFKTLFFLSVMIPAPYLSYSMHLFRILSSVTKLSWLWNYALLSMLKISDICNTISAMSSFSSHELLFKCLQTSLDINVTMQISGGVWGAMLPRCPLDPPLPPQ